MENIIYDKSFNLSKKIIRFQDRLTETEKVNIANIELLKSILDIGSHLSESRFSDSKIFLNQHEKAHQAALRSKYYLELCKEFKIVNDKAYDAMLEEVDHVEKMLAKAIKTMKENN